MDRVSPRVARGMMWIALGLIVLIRLLNGITHHRGGCALALTMLPYPPLVALLWRPWPRRLRYGLVVVVTGLAALPFQVVGTDWDWIPWTVGAALLVALPGRAATALFLGLLGAVLAGGLLEHDGAVDAISRATATVNDALIVFSLYSLAGMIRDLNAAQGELARLAALRERLRLDSELRTVVGGGLRAIGELLSPGGPEGVRDAAERARRTLAGIREAAAEYRTEGVAADRPGPRSPRITWLVLLGVLCMQGLARTAAVASADPAQLPVILPIVATIIVLYLVPHFRFRLLLIALLTFPLAWPGSYLVPTWGLVDGMWGFFIGLALVRLRPPASLAVVAGVLCLHVVLWVTPPPVLPPVQIGSGLVSDLILGGLVYSMTRLGELVAVLERARHELAEEAVTKERVRIARDLHDVLGFSLSAVALRGELALRLLDRDPERAEAELASLRELVGRSAAELDSITDGRIRLRLAEEIDTARQVLEAAGVMVETLVDTGPLDRETDTALAAVLRESVTNVLRHSRARECAITVVTDGGLVRLTIANDGVPPPVAAQRDGTGLDSLAARTGGRLTASPRPGGRYELVAEFESDPAPLGGDADGVDAVAGA